MKFTTLIISLWFYSFNFCQSHSEYDLKPYNEHLKYRLIDENEVLEKDDALQVLIIVFNYQKYENALLSISNNPQLKEIKIFGGNQYFLESLSTSELPRLTHLFFKQFAGTSLEVPPFPNLEHLTIQSTELISLDMVNSSLDKLLILDFYLPKLKNWNTAKHFPQLQLIGLEAPALEHFPIENMPNIFQFVYTCSLKELPINICNYKELQHISFNNLTPVKISKCFKKKVLTAYYSDIVVYDGMDGKIIIEVQSRDKKGKN